MANSTETIAENRWDEHISGKKRLFCLHYCTDKDCFMNGTRAFKKANPTCKDDNVAAASASRLLRNVKVKEACRRLLKLTQAELDINNTYRILRDLELFAMYNPADIINAEGNLVVSDLTELGQSAKCIAGIETRYTQSGLKYTVIKLIDRNKSIEALSKYLNLIRSDTTLQIELPVIMGERKIDLEKWGIQVNEQDNSDGSGIE